VFLKIAAGGKRGRRSPVFCFVTDELCKGLAKCRRPVFIGTMNDNIKNHFFKPAIFPACSGQPASNFSFGPVFLICIYPVDEF